jgi:hypothetical protein
VLHRLQVQAHSDVSFNCLHSPSCCRNRCSRKARRKALRSLLVQLAKQAPRSSGNSVTDKHSALCSWVQPAYARCECEKCVCYFLLREERASPTSIKKAVGTSVWGVHQQPATRQRASALQTLLCFICCFCASHELFINIQMYRKQPTHGCAHCVTYTWLNIAATATASAAAAATSLEHQHRPAVFV